ncbi:MFS transporter, partial [Streptomyces sp. NPDC056161]|uniref:MFS transporter n=1 Tax=Streptomyces sp. NPDC056161 TaxID=3345732 RepID=UPI0035DC0F15
MTTADPPDDALAEPVERVGRGWTAALSLANGAIWVGWFGPLQILLAAQAEDFAPGSGMSKETMLAWVTAAGAVVSLAANPFFGALSDRTTSARGRRTPWIVAGAAGGAVSLSGESTERSAGNAAWCRRAGRATSAGPRTHDAPAGGPGGRAGTA